MPDKPLWRKAFDSVERRLAPQLEELVQTSSFADASALALKLQAEVRHRVERRTQQLWHMANLPAGSDVSRLREQVAALDRQLRDLTAALEDAQKEHQDAHASQHPDPAGHGRPRSPRGRAQRAARP